jgi:hypothetical protein
VQDRNAGLDKTSIAESFARQGYVAVQGLLDAAGVERVNTHLHARASQGLMLASGDEQVPGTPHVYGDQVVDSLMQTLWPEIEAHTGLLLFPTYSFARIYKHGDALAPHRDRAACEVSVSLNLSQIPAEPWALHVGEGVGAFAALMTPGDGLIYRGAELTHWREPFAGQKMAQVFLHYVDRNGAHAGEKFDRRPTLGNAYRSAWIRR